MTCRLFWRLAQFTPALWFTLDLPCCDLGIGPDVYDFGICLEDVEA